MICSVHSLVLPEKLLCQHLVPLRLGEFSDSTPSIDIVKLGSHYDALEATDGYDSNTTSSIESVEKPNIDESDESDCENGSTSKGPLHSTAR